MALEQKLNLKLAQRLVMTPTLQQAIKLLQLSRLELEQAVAEELQANPLLEQSEEPGSESGAGGEEGATAAGENPEASGTEGASGEAGVGGEESGAGAEESGADSYSEVELESLFANYLQDSSGTAALWEDEEGAPLENSATPTMSLFDSVCAQLRLGDVRPELLPVCEFVAGNLDPDGFLRTSGEELAAQLGVPAEKLAEAVAVIQALEPAGIAARSLRECFALQLTRLESEDAETLDLARRIVDESFDDLLHQRWSRISQRLGVDQEAIRIALEVIRHLDPRPGAGVGPSDNATIEPDLSVEKIAGHWRVTLNDDGMPRLRLSQRYVRLLQSRTADGETSHFLRERMRAALWFLRSLDQRQSTILRVAEALVRRQQDFLERGLPQLRPLVLRDIADDIGMHESTVSRVVSKKYIATPRGVLPLKFFFHSSISHALDGDISSLVVKQRIKEVVAAEEAAKPLSDARIARMLNRQGIRIARRTVAKYREELGIPSSEQRRRVLRSALPVE